MAENLGFPSDRGEGKNFGVRANFGITLHTNVAVEMHAPSDFNPRTDNTKRPNGHVVINFRFGVNDCEIVNFSHPSSPFAQHLLF